MKRFLLPLCTICLMAGCGTRSFENAAPEGLSSPILPLRMSEGTQQVFLTDYLPTWERADSLTAASETGLCVVPVAEDWSEFTLTVPADVQLATLSAWQQGEAVSIVALGAKRDADAVLFTNGSMLSTVTLAASKEPTKVVALWQNCRLDAANIRVQGTTIEVKIPNDAKQLERSFLRVFAQSSEGLFNDVLIPLQRGKVVKTAAELTRRDQQAQVLYSLMIDRFYDADPTNNQPLNSPEVLPQADYQGGDLKGITAKIEAGFFERLGISTIWISPITQNPRDAWGLNLNPRTKFSGYHGYWPIYTTEVDDRFGTSEELKEMLATAHAHKMNVVLDYVANHLHINSPVLQAHPDWVIPLMLPDGRKNIGLWDEHRLTTWFDEHIPSLDLERIEVAEPMTDSATFWMTEYDFDG
ncbi:MAG: hypothetical protein J6R73_00520, partial [Alistipes sp.]|nr:hypothetical protein [Alistipes sp.]